MNNRLVSCLDDKVYLGNQHNSFCMTRLLRDRTAKKSGATVFLSSVCTKNGCHGNIFEMI